jgi:hypothetical protein
VGNRNATKAYQQLFEDWCREKRVRDITEEVLLAYFEQKSRKLKGSTLWSNFEGLNLLEIFRTYFSLRPSPIEITENTVAEGYIEDSVQNKLEVSSKILGKKRCSTYL